MPDIFISYSRKDSAQALALAERLRASGMEVWIDQQGIVGAEKWTTEIVQGIRDCATFILLLSPDAVMSENVLRELLLASEKQKRILPIEVRATELPVSFEYPLAGLQRVRITDFEGIQKAVSSGAPKRVVTKRRLLRWKPLRWKRGWAVALTSIVAIALAYYLFGPKAAHNAKAEARKSLMVLPLEDLSQSHDSSWLADGIMTEMITSLSGVKGLQVIDLNTSLQYKAVKQSTAEIANDLNVRYFVEGTLRRSGTNVNVSLQLVDQETHANLWTREFKCESNNILALQESIGTSIVDGLKLNLPEQGVKGVSAHGTENPEAYSLYLRGLDIHQSLLLPDMRTAFSYFSKAVTLDSNFIEAQAWRARGLVETSQAARGLVASQGDSAKLNEAEGIALRILQRKPDFGMCYVVLGFIYQSQGRMERAEQSYREAVRVQPDYFWGHYILGAFLIGQGERDEAEKELQEAVRLNPHDLYGCFGLILIRHNIGDTAGAAYYVRAARPEYERLLRLRPGDEQLREQYAAALAYAGDLQKSAAVLAPLESRNNISPLTWYNMACTAVYLGREESAFKWLNRMIDIAQDTLIAPSITVLKTDVDLVPLHDRPQWPGIVKRYDAKLHSFEHQKAKR